MEEMRPPEEEPIQDPERGEEIAESVSVTHHPRPKKVYKGMWGTAEIVTVGVSLFLLTAAVAGYLFFTMPATRELQTVKVSTLYIFLRINIDTLLSTPGLSSIKARIARRFMILLRCFQWYFQWLATFPARVV